MTELVVGRRCLEVRRILGDVDPGTMPIVTQEAALPVVRELAAEAEALGIGCDVLVVPDGEAAKSLAVVEEVVRWLLDLGVRRDGLIVAVGGGAVTDLAGFVAAVYLRGVDAVYVPTTLLGAVDAAIGGKTGIDVDGKNVVGVFRHPRRVLVDVDVLDRLPTELKRQGLAEALKAGLVGDPDLVAALERDRLDVDLESVVRRAIDVKLAIVGRDFEEAGERAHLNYGHTVGHAVETVTGIGHGDAVAVGMIAAGRVSALTVGFADEDRQRDAIAGLGLPVRSPAADREEVVRHVWRDKKRDGAGLRMVVLERIGVPGVVHVDAATVDAALDAVGLQGGT
jgi:3-dehydroquinate synthase